MSEGIVRHGVHAPLEMAANELIRKSLEGVTSMAAKSDILTPWKEQDRRRREVYTAEGVPDESIRRGLYGRASNTRQTHLNSRDGIARAYRGMQSLQRFVDQHGGGVHMGDEDS